MRERSKQTQPPKAQILWAEPAGAAPGQPPAPPGAGSNTVYNICKAGLMGAATTGPPAAKIDLIADTIKVLLVTSGVTVNADHDFVADLVASEISTTNYTGGFGGAGRKALASRTLARNLALDRGEFGAAGLTWTALGPASGGPTIGGAVVFKELTSDALSPLIAFLAVTNTQVNGGDGILSFSGGLVLTLT